MAKTTKKTTIQFYKLREVESPSYNNSAGIDFYIPYNITINEIASMQYPRYDDNEPRVQIKADAITGTVTQYTVPPRARLVIPTGIKIKFPEGKSGLFLNKWRIALNTGINVINSFVDGNTLSELKINIVNTSDVPVNINPGKQIAQMIIVDTPLYELEQVVSDDFYEGISEESVKVDRPSTKVNTHKQTRLSEEELRQIEEEVEKQYSTENVNQHLNMIGG